MRRIGSSFLVISVVLHLFSTGWGVWHQLWHHAHLFCSHEPAETMQLHCDRHCTHTHLTSADSDTPQAPLPSQGNYLADHHYLATSSAFVLLLPQDAEARPPIGQAGTPGSAYLRNVFHPPCG